jgi:hypothetical protein
MTPGVSTLPSVVLLFHDFGDAEEPGANLKAGAVCREAVEFKMNLIIFDREVDDAAQHSEPFGFVNRQSP